MKKRILVIITLIVVPICILLVDHYILKDDVYIDPSYDLSESWNYIVEHKKEYPSSLLLLASRNRETIPFVADYINDGRKNCSMNISHDLKDKQVPLLLQWDKRWGYKSYGDDMMAINGCGPTCLSMVVSYLTKSDKYHPYYIAQFAIENGYCDGKSTLWSLMSEGARRLGIKATELSLSEDVVIRQLEAGNPIICSMSKGIFTTTGHFIVLKEYKNGKIYVNDPNSKEKSERGYTFEEIKYQIKNLWAYQLVSVKNLGR